MKSAYIHNITEGYVILDTPQMVEVDRLMIETYHIDLIQMMENAGRCLAIVAREVFLSGDPKGKTIAVLAGTGGNGGGALVCARRLHNWGAHVEVFMTKDSEEMTPIPGHQRRILERMGISIRAGSELPADNNYDLLIDGIIGYNVKGDPRGVAGEMINWVNKQATQVLSLDTPSGLDLSSGTVHTPTVAADATLTLAMPKKGLFHPDAKAVIGQLYLGDISVPPQLYSEPSLALPAENPFQFSDVVRIY